MIVRGRDASGADRSSIPGSIILHKLIESEKFRTNSAIKTLVSCTRATTESVEVMRTINCSQTAPCRRRTVCESGVSDRVVCP
jgi:hypothetical protein